MPQTPPPAAASSSSNTPMAAASSSSSSVALAQLMAENAVSVFDDQSMWARGISSIFSQVSQEDLGVSRHLRQSPFFWDSTIKRAGYFFTFYPRPRPTTLWRIWFLKNQASGTGGRVSASQPRMENAASSHCGGALEAQCVGLDKKTVEMLRQAKSEGRSFVELEVKRELGDEKSDDAQGEKKQVEYKTFIFRRVGSAAEVDLWAEAPMIYEEAAISSEGVSYPITDYWYVDDESTAVGACRFGRLEMVRVFRTEEARACYEQVWHSFLGLKTRRFPETFFGNFYAMLHARLAGEKFVNPFLSSLAERLLNRPSGEMAEAHAKKTILDIIRFASESPSVSDESSSVVSFCSWLEQFRNLSSLTANKAVEVQVDVLSDFSRWLRNTDFNEPSVSADVASSASSSGAGVGTVTSPALYRP